MISFENSELCYTYNIDDFSIIEMQNTIQSNLIEYEVKECKIVKDKENSMVIEIYIGRMEKFIMGKFINENFVKEIFKNFQEINNFREIAQLNPKIIFKDDEKNYSDINYKIQLKHFNNIYGEDGCSYNDYDLIDLDHLICMENMNSFQKF